MARLFSRRNALVRRRRSRSRVIYGHVSTANDIRRINEMIRRQMLAAKSRAQLTELVKRSQYLYTLTFSSAWRRLPRRRFRKVAWQEYLKTAELANRIARERGLGPANYGPD